MLARTRGAATVVDCHVLSFMSDRARRRAAADGLARAGCSRRAARCDARGPPPGPTLERSRDAAELRAATHARPPRRRGDRRSAARARRASSAHGARTCGDAATDPSDASALAGSLTRAADPGARAPATHAAEARALRVLREVHGACSVPARSRRRRRSPRRAAEPAAARLYEPTRRRRSAQRLQCSRTRARVPGDAGIIAGSPVGSSRAEMALGTWP